MTTKTIIPTVLVVNDDEGGRCLTVRQLEPHFNLAQAATGAEGLEKSLGGPDLVLLDVNLPDMSGLEVCRKLKKNPVTAHIPVLHMSAVVLDPASRATALENGADDFILQPTEAAVLVATINSLLRIKKAEADLAAANEQLAILSGIDRIFLSTAGEETWKALLAAVLKVFSSPAGSMGYLNESGEMVLGAVTGADWKERHWAGAMGSGEVEVRNEPPPRELPDGHLNLERVLSIPLMDGGRAAGQLTLANKPRPYDAADVSMAKALSGHIAALLKGRLEAGKSEERNRQMMLEMSNMQKIESLGQLAGGIAHDFNNILTGIIGNLSLLNSAGGLGEEAMAIIKDTLSASDGARKITRQLLTFAKGGQPVKRVFSFREALASWCAFSLRGSRSKLLVSIDWDLWPMNGDEGQLSQAVNNLLRNSREAMPQGGVLRVYAGNFEHKPEPGLPLPAGKYVRLVVADNGIGIPAGCLEKIFEPYFTTKTQGHGLGLSMAYSIIKSHGGHIKVRSAPGSGTEFEVYLPAAAGEAAAPGAAPAAALKGSGLVLVMDDEEIVRKAASRMLKALGYDCVCAADGKEALGLYRDALGKPGAFKAVIMDLTIPGGMGGAEAVKKLLEMDPLAKAVVSSGYSDDNSMSDYKRAGFSAVLQKPYRYEDLAAALAGLLPAAAEDSDRGRQV